MSSARHRCVVVGDRLALAADLEDLVTHRMTAVQVHATAAERRDAAEMAAALRLVAELSSEATADLRRLALLLDDGRPPTLRPTPTLAAIPALLDGRPDAVVDIDDGLDEIPAGVAVCAYRYVELLLEAGAAHLTVSGHNGHLWIAGAPGASNGSRSPLLARARGIVLACRGDVAVAGGVWTARLRLRA